MHVICIATISSTTKPIVYKRILMLAKNTNFLQSLPVSGELEPHKWFRAYLRIAFSIWAFECTAAALLIEASVETVGLVLLGCRACFISLPSL